MSRDGLLLGFFATCSQVLLLRGLVASLGGSELVIGVALFGWLIFVALGAGVGGRAISPSNPGPLFVVGVLLLMVSMVAIKLVPLVVTDVAGEVIPLSTAFVISIMLVAPVAFVSGWLFPVIARGRGDQVNSVTTVYMFEGLGAFAGGLILVLAVGDLLSDFGVGLMIGTITMLGLSLPIRKSLPAILYPVLGLGLSVASIGWGNALAHLLEGVRNPGYEIESSFDTHYGHQAVITREGDLVLLTDNAVEAIHPDLEKSENLLVPPLVYCPNARDVLLLGRSEMGVGQLAAKLRGVNLTAVDPRGVLSEVLDRYLGEASSLNRIADDPAAYLSETARAGQFDIIILDPGSFDSYRNSRFITAEFLKEARRCMKPHGVFFLPTSYDTDRYISSEVSELLSIIYQTLSGSFVRVAAWPGNRTLFMASDSLRLDLPYDTIVDRLSQLPHRADYISEDYLADRLGEFKRQRLSQAMQSGETSNRLIKPVLTTLQAWYRSKTGSVDRGIMEWIIRKPGWLILVPLAILILFGRVVAGPRRDERYALYLYFIAGLASLSLELVAFYVYQSVSGTLYQELAILIGTFMVGLALGAYAASRTTGSGLDRLALATLLAATILYGLTWNAAPCRLVLIYNLLFLLVVSLATGSLFVAATRLYYGGVADRNRGTGYAWELVGSALGAVLTTTVLLPVIGLDWLLISIAVLLVTAGLAGAKIATP